MGNRKTSKIFALVTFLVCTGGALFFFWQLKQERQFVIGVITPHEESKESGKGFIKKLEELGYVEGRNVRYIRHFTKEATEEAVQNMIAQKADLIFSYTTPSTKIVKKGLTEKDIPVVFIVYDALRSKLVNDLRQPAGNLTGIQLRGSTAKSVEYLLAVKPDIDTIFVPVVFDTGAAKLTIEDLEAVAKILNLTLIVKESKTAEELKASLVDIPEEVDALYIPHSILIEKYLDDIIDAAIREKLPTASAGHEQFHDGVLIDYGPDETTTGRQLASFAHKVLTGIKPDMIPVQTAEYFLGINLKAAEKIDLEIPDSVIEEADVILRD